MWDVIANIMQPATLVTLLVGMAAFAAVLSVAAPLTQNDALRSRMKAVGAERDRLRAAERAKAGNNESRLRDLRQPGLAKQLVDTLNLRRVFEAEPSRELLRQAGMRSERHLILYLAARLVAPIAAGLFTFIYVSAFFPDDIPPPMRLAAGAMAMIAGNYLPYMIIKNFVQRRQQSIRRAWPDALDLMLICVEAGMAIEPAMQRVAREIGAVSVPLAEEMTLTVAELSFLPERRKAFENLGKRTGLQQVKSVVTSLIQSERYGTPMGTALRVLAQENRDMRMAEAERKAASLPPMLTVPMMIFFMPGVFAIVLGPAIMGVIQLM